MEKFFNEILPLLITFGIPILIGIVGSSKKKKKRRPLSTGQTSIFSDDSSKQETDSEIEEIFAQHEAAQEEEPALEYKDMSVQEAKQKLEKEWEEARKKKREEKVEQEEKDEHATIIEGYEEGEQMTDNTYKRYYPTHQKKKSNAIDRIREDFDLEEAIIYSEIINRKHF